MGGLGSWWGTRQEDMNEDSAERGERKAWVPKQELNWTSYSCFKLGLLEDAVAVWMAERSIPLLVAMKHQL